MSSIKFSISMSLNAQRILSFYSFHIITVTNTNTFIVFSATGDSNTSFTLITTRMTWMDAQLHCRKAYTDFAIVRNQTENGIIALKTRGPKMWIGLYRDSWKWSDGSQQSFDNWGTNSPSLLYTYACAVANFGKWSNQRCDVEFSFLCYTGEFRFFNALQYSTSTNMHKLMIIISLCRALS